MTDISHYINPILKSKNKTSMNSDSLFSGKMGSILGVAELYKTNPKDEYFNYIHKELNELLDKLNEGEISSLSICNGLTGILLGILILKRDEIIDFDTDELNVFNELLAEQLISKLKAEEIDYLHEALGIFHYFVMSFDLSHNMLILEYVKEALDILFSTKKNYGKGLYWENKMEVPAAYDNSGINLSLSHGQASVLAVLTNLYTILKKQNMELPILNELLSGSMKLYEEICEKITIKEGNYSFPDWIRNNSFIPSRRLAWCYGDLGTIYTLMKTSHVLNNEKLYEKCVQILLNTLTIPDDKNGLKDVGLCHGASGITYLYKKCYELTQNLMFKNAYLKWKEKILEMLTFDGYGLQNQKVDETGDKILDDSFLEGLSGVILTLLAVDSEQSSPVLDTCLILN